MEMISPTKTLSLLDQSLGRQNTFTKLNVATKKQHQNLHVNNHARELQTQAETHEQEIKPAHD